MSNQASISLDVLLRVLYANNKQEYIQHALYETLFGNDLLPSTIKVDVYKKELPEGYTFEDDYSRSTMELPVVSRVPYVYPLTYIVVLPNNTTAERTEVSSNHSTIRAVVPIEVEETL